MHDDEMNLTITKFNTTKNAMQETIVQSVINNQDDVPSQLDSSMDEPGMQSVFIQTVYGIK